MTDSQTPNKEKLKELKYIISRFLESYRNSTGLNFISGFVRLALNEYSDSDGKERFESTLRTVQESFSQEQQSDFLDRLKMLGKCLTEEQQEELATSIIKFYPEILEELAEYYDLPHLLNHEYEKKIIELKKLNKKLYDQFAKI